MRFLHTADWHLGRTLNGLSLLEDQAYVLDALVDAAGRLDLDAVVLAGDVFDQAVPSPDAIRLFDDVIHRLVVGCGLPTIVIAGNHDDPIRLAAHDRLLRDRGLHIAGPLADPVACVDVPSRGGRVTRFHALPFADPMFVRSKYGGEARDHAAAMIHTLKHLHGDGDVARHVAIGHAFVAGGSESESERLIRVGDAGRVPASCFADCTPAFDYVALGHLHRPQSVGGPTVAYSGSILKYSLSEADDVKGFRIIDLSSDTLESEHIDLRPRRDLREVRATLDEVLGMDESDDLVFVTLLDPSPVLNPMARVRQVFPNALQVRREIPRRAPARPAEEALPESNDDRDANAPPDEEEPAPPRLDLKSLSDLDLFRRFVRSVAGAELSEAQQTTFERAAAKVRRRELGREEGGE